MSALDLFLVCEAFGWQRKQVEDLIKELDPSHADEYNFQEFILILKYIEKNQDNSLPQIANQRTLNHSPSTFSNRHSARASVLNSEATLDSAYQVYQEHRKYGALLPKSGVYFVPDEKLVSFLRTIREKLKHFE